MLAVMMPLLKSAPGAAWSSTGFVFCVGPYLEAPGRGKQGTGTPALLIYHKHEKYSGELNI